MSDLKKMISDFVENHYPKISNKEKEILNKVSFLKILNQDYYNNRYHTASIATFNKKNYFFITNEYDLQASSNINAKFHFDKQSYTPQYEDYNSVKEIIVNSEVFRRIEKFKDIVFHSKEQEEYANNIINIQKKDPDFIPTLFSFSFLFKDFNYYFFNDSIKVLLNKEGINEIYSKKAKTEVYLNSKIDFSQLDVNTIKNFLSQWKESYNSRVTSIDNGFKKITDINKYAAKFNKKINHITEHIAQEKEFLFNPININDISFSYYEISHNTENASWDEGKKFLLKHDLEFKEDILNKNSIIKSEIYNIDYDNISDYQEMKNLLRPHIINYDNELTNSFKGAFYGLDYIDSAIKGNVCDRYYIIAKYHNETVGMISFRAEENIPNSTIKNIEYICVKDNFRGSGLAPMLYQKLADLFTDNKNILFNSMYSKQGAFKLPKIKNKVRLMNPDFLFIDKDLGNYSHKSSFERFFLRDFNEHFMNYLSLIERKEQVDLKKCIGFLNYFYKEKVKTAEAEFLTIPKDQQRLYSNTTVSEAMTLLRCELDKLSLEKHLKNTIKKKKSKNNLV